MSVNPDTAALSGHRKRLRARLEREPLAVADDEVLELVLALGLARKDTKRLARRLMERFQTLRGALDAREDELEQVEGFGPGLSSLWRLLRELMARYALSPLMEREVLATPEAVAAAARQRLGNMSHEESWLALVDSQNRLIAWERLRRGGVASISIQPRDVLEAALARKASGVILVHNHPGGDPTPSQADKETTERLKSAAPQVGVRFLDHVIVTSGDCYSLSSGRKIRPLEVINGIQTK